MATQIPKPPVVMNLPEAPTRKTAKPDFVVMADNFVKAQQPWGQRVNEVAEWMRGIGALVMQYAQTNEDWYDRTVQAGKDAENEAKRAKSEADRAASEVTKAKAEVTRAAKEADRSERAKRDAQQLVALTNKEVDLPEMTLNGAPLIVSHEDPKRVRFADTVWNYGVDVKPKLRLDFLNQKRLDPRINFTRASTATYTDAMGNIRTAGINEPRFTYDPVTGEALGLLVEKQATNVAINSNQFEGGWTAIGVTVDGYVTAPDGTAAPIWLASNIEEVHRLSRGALSGGAGNTAHTGSFYVYLPTGHDVIKLFIRIRSSADGQAVHVLVDGSGDAATFTFESSQPFGTNAPPSINANALNVTPAGNGWHRIAITSSVTATTNKVTAFDFGFTRGTVEIAAGTSNTRIALFGAQLEEGSTPTTYIPTEGSQVTRATDNLLRELGEEINQDDFTLLVDFVPEYTGSSSHRYVAIMESIRNRVVVGYLSPGVLAIYYGAQGNFYNTDIILPSGLDLRDRPTIKLAIAKKGRTVKAVANGGEIAESTAIEDWLEDVNCLRIGKESDNTIGGGIFAKSYLYPRALTDAQLQELTQ